MRFRGILGLAALLSVSFSVGCTMTNPTVRGQGPDTSGPIIGSAPGYGDFKRTPYAGRAGAHDFRVYSGFRDNNFGYEGGYYAGPNGYQTGLGRTYTAGDNGGCQQCNNGQSCPQGGCQRCGRGCGYRNGAPQHYQTYQYNWPQSQVYPQHGVPSGIIQYPYYTLRGPTDFFMEKSL